MSRKMPIHRSLMMGSTVSFAAAAQDSKDVCEQVQVLILKISSKKLLGGGHRYWVGGHYY